MYIDDLRQKTKKLYNKLNFPWKLLRSKCFKRFNYIMMKVLGDRVSQMIDNSHFYWDLLQKKKNEVTILAPIFKDSITIWKDNPKRQEPCRLINKDDI